MCLCIIMLAATSGKWSCSGLVFVHHTVCLFVFFPVISVVDKHCHKNGTLFILTVAL